MLLSAPLRSMDLRIVLLDPQPEGSPIEQVHKKEFQMAKPGFSSLTRALSHIFSANFMKKKKKW